MGTTTLIDETTFDKDSKYSWVCGLFADDSVWLRTTNLVNASSRKLAILTGWKPRDKEVINTTLRWS